MQVTPQFLSPEVLQTALAADPASSPYDTKAADVWAVGVVLATLLTGRYENDDTVGNNHTFFLDFETHAYCLPCT
jgi:serine/threonine protein kinase